jgi:Ca2+-binding RTX toxin-like protein
MSEMSDLAEALDSQLLNDADGVLKAYDIYGKVKGLFEAWSASGKRSIYEDYLRGKPLHCITDAEIDALSALKIDEAGKATALFDHPSGDLTELARGLDVKGNREWKVYRELARAKKGLIGYKDMGCNSPNVDPNTNRPFKDAQDWRQPTPRRRHEPLALDLDGDGIETVGASTNTPILFDHEIDGSKNGTGWITADDAMLVLDRNGNGTIDNGRELFGDSTIKSNGQTAMDGFDALADLDSNSDGVMNSSDTQFANLRLWRDLNQDGVSQSGELFTLNALGVASIALTNKVATTTLANQNQILATGQYTKADGTTGVVADVNFVADSFHREFTSQLDTSAVASLPDMQGSGAVRDLREAATQSTTLQNLLSQYSVATTREGQMALIDKLLSAWADTSGFSTLEARELARASAYNNFVGNVLLFPNYLGGNASGIITYNALGSDTLASNVSLSNSVAIVSDVYLEKIAFWRQRMHVLEAFNGEYFAALPNDMRALEAIKASLDFANTYNTGATISLNYTNVAISYSQPQLDLLTQSYDALRESVYSALILQTRLKPYLDAVALEINSDGINLNFDAMNTLLQVDMVSNPQNGLTNLLELYKYAGDFLKPSGWDDDGQISSWLSDLPSEFGPNLLTQLGFRTTTTGDDTLIGTNGGSSLNGGSGNDNIIGGTGNDTIIDTSGNERIYGGDGDDIITDAGAGTNTLRGGAGHDTITLSYASNNTVEGGEGNDLIRTSTVMDSAEATLHSNTLSGGTGTDRLEGGASADTYLFNRGDGQDTISDLDQYSNWSSSRNRYKSYAGGKTDTVAFGAGITSDNIVATRVGNNLILNITDPLNTGAADQITIENWFNGTSYRIEQFTFADGTTLDQVELNARIVMQTGSVSNDILQSLAGNNILQGLAGVDSLTDTVDNNLMSGGGEADSIITGNSNDLLIGGLGNDTITTGTGYDVISFNKGDGQDIINASTGEDNTISIGGGVIYAEMSLNKLGNNLVLNTGSTDQLTLKDWYLGTTNKSVVNMQVIAEAMADFNLGSSDALRDNKVESFNFASLVNQFDAEGATANWQLTDARLTAHLQAGSDTAAIGGDLAYQYGRNSNLTGMGLANAQSVIAAASFGQTAQTLNNPTVWQAEVVKLG